MRAIVLAASLLGASHAGWAQGNVSIYGIADAFVGSTQSGPARTQKVGEGGHAASRLGFRGTEDLGGGLKAYFVLEGGIGLDTGTGIGAGGGFRFNRQALVGVSGAWGSVEAGHMYTPMFLALVRVDPLVMNQSFSPMLSLLGSNDAQPGAAPFAARASNMLRYRSPRGPLVLDIAAAPGESAGPSRRSGDFAGAALAWTQGPLHASYAIQWNESGSAAAPVAAPVRLTHQALSASYDLAGLRLSAQLVRRSSEDPAVPRARIVSLGARYQFAPSQAVLANVFHRDVAGSPRAQRAWAAGYDYQLSKRTTLYARVISLDNRGGASARLADVPVVANSGDGARQWGIGMRHNF